MQQCAAIYCRLSKEDDDRALESESIQNQKNLLVSYAKEHHFLVHDIYVDDDYSGLDRNRPEFNRMIEDAQMGLFNIVLCKTQSRFTRDMEMVEKYIHGLFIALNIRFVSVVDNVDTSVKGNKKARQIYGLINEWYSEDLSDNIRSVFRRKMQEGQFIGSFAPYGYRKDLANHNKLVIDEEAAAVVCQIFGLYLHGHGYMAIASHLTANNILPPTLYKNRSGLTFRNPNFNDKKEAAWSANTVKRILKSCTYLGHIVQGKEQKLSYKSEKILQVPKERWIVVENMHEPIIDEHSFNMAQELMKQRRPLGRPGTVGHIFSGKLKCLHCGSNLHKAAPTKDKSSYYMRCAKSGKGCTAGSTRLDSICRDAERRIKEVHGQQLPQGGLTEEIIRDFIECIQVGKNQIVIHLKC